MTVPAPATHVVTTDWLAEHLGEPGVVVLDATVLFVTEPRPSYVSGHELFLLDGHIPGAYFADVIDEFSDPLGTHPFTKPDAQRFALAAGALGIDNTKTVIVYDSAVGQWAARIWWLFRAFGFDNVAVLDGGFTKWRLEDRPTDIGHHEPVPATFTTHERPELWADKTLVQNVSAGVVPGSLVCALPPKEFSGEQPTRARAGHIPGSVNLPAGRLVHRDTRTLLPAKDLAASFPIEPLLSSELVVAYCNGGIAAAAGALALTVLGHQNVAVYDGSLNEWAADPAAPLATISA